MGFVFHFFPNETSFWETPLRIKEKASDWWGNEISGPNPAAEFGCVRPVFSFPNETSFWGTPLRIKEKASDRWGNLISGPNPPAEFVRVRVLVFFGQNNLIPTSKQALKSFCLRIWARRVGSSQPALGGFGPGE